MNYSSQQRWFVVAIFTTIQTIGQGEAGFACINNPCINGICIDDLNSTYTCYCIDGFTGIHCETNWDECWSSPCVNGGTCIDGVASYNCSCVQGFTGENCERDIDECISNPCLNNGICVDAHNGYECRCFPGFIGQNCETDLAVCNTTNELKCHNNALCTEGPGLAFNCHCQRGWSGNLCQYEMNECLSSPCLNGGVCLDLHADYSCACAFGYTGHNCETELKLCELNLCENGALCLMEKQFRVCYCVPDFHGDKCQFQYDECQLKGRCYNGGTCVDGVDSYSCSCPSLTSGPNCECILQTSDTYDCNTSISGHSTNVSRGVLLHSFTHPYTTSTITKPYFTLATIHGKIPETPTNGTTAFEVTTQKSEVLEMTTLALEYEEFYTTIQEDSSPSAITTFPESKDATSTLLQSTTMQTTSEKDTLTSTIHSKYEAFSTTEAELITSDATFKSPTDVPVSQSALVTLSTTYGTEYEASTEWHEEAKTTDFTYVNEEWNITRFFMQPTNPPLGCHNVSCLNGGNCYSTKYGPKCICKIGWDGLFCEYSISIKVVALTGRSYLMHYLNNGTSTIISVQLKTVSSIGVIFYAQITNNMYMYLYVQDGYLKFQFSCGVQTMLFSETKYRINNGYETSVLATVTFNTDLQNDDAECNAALRINNTVAMSGEQTTSIEQKFLNLPILYIGGFPMYLIQQLDLPVVDGIIGCMHSLQIDGIHRELYTGAFDAHEISECSSLACISNPCHQSATCIEQGTSWTCICPSGYVGKICNISVCDNNPCQFGATCVQYPTNGFLCLCPLGKHGLYCEKDLEISQPTFSSTIRGYSSFVAYRLPLNSVSPTFELRLKFIPETMEQISLMVFVGHQDGPTLGSQYLSLSFIKGYIALTWNLGAGPRRIFTPRPIMKRGKRTHSVKIGRTGTRAWLYVDGFKNITGRSLGQQAHFNFTPIIYMGGYESFNFEDLPHDLPLHSGFAGCIFDAELHTSRIVLGLQKTHPITGRSVAQCGTGECTNYTCQHGGVCLQYGATYSCLCPDGWFGPICAYRYNLCDSNHHKCSEGSTCVPLAVTYECDCPVGRTGKYCEKSDNQLSDIFFSGQRSYLLYSLERNFHTKQFTFELELKPLNDRSLILYAVKPHSSFFISVIIQGGIIELRLITFGSARTSEYNGDMVSVKSGTIISTGEWATLRAGRFGQKLYLTVNGVTNSKVMPPDNNVMLDNIFIYFGGVENLATVPPEVTSGLPQFYYGCIRKVFINYRHIILNPNTISLGRNIADCDGTSCGADVCANGGTCWLNTTLEPYCMCPEEYTGDRCEEEVSCDLVPCKNQGQCVLNKNQPVCQCPLGWIGSFCEKEMPSTTPFLKGNGYIIVNRKTAPFKKRQLISTENNKTLDDYIYIKFSTSGANGLLLWNAKGDKFFGIGISDGNLKIVCPLCNSINQFLVDSYVAINNGIWHTIIFRFNNPLITLTVDGEEWHIKGPSVDNILTDDNLFYLGGFPDEPVYNVTGGIFSSNFNGCIEEFAWNEQMIINNFKRYKAENVGSCFENRNQLRNN